VLVFPTRRQALKALPVVLPLATIPIGLVTLESDPFKLKHIRHF
jgi:hypothetical protein